MGGGQSTAAAPVATRYTGPAPRSTITNGVRTWGYTVEDNNARKNEICGPSDNWWRLDGADDSGPEANTFTTLNECAEACENHDDCVAFSVHPNGLHGDGIENNSYVICNGHRAANALPVSTSGNPWRCFRPVALSCPRGQAQGVISSTLSSCGPLPSTTQSTTSNNCHANCATCTGPGVAECLTCPGSMVLNGNAPAQCVSPSSGTPTQVVYRTISGLEGGSPGCDDANGNYIEEDGLKNDYRHWIHENGEYELYRYVHGTQNRWAIQKRGSDGFGCGLAGCGASGVSQHIAFKVSSADEPPSGSWSGRDCSATGSWSSGISVTISDDTSSSNISSSDTPMSSSSVSPTDGVNCDAPSGRGGGCTCSNDMDCLSGDCQDSGNDILGGIHLENINDSGCASSETEEYCIDSSNGEIKTDKQDHCNEGNPSEEDCRNRWGTTQRAWTNFGVAEGEKLVCRWNAVGNTCDYWIGPSSSRTPCIVNSSDRTCTITFYDNNGCEGDAYSTTITGDTESINREECIEAGFVWNNTECVNEAGSETELRKPRIGRPIGNQTNHEHRTWGNYRNWAAGHEKANSFKIDGYCEGVVLEECTESTGTGIADDCNDVLITKSVPHYTLSSGVQIGPKPNVPARADQSPPWNSNYLRTYSSEGTEQPYIDMDTINPIRGESVCQNLSGDLKNDVVNIRAIVGNCPAGKKVGQTSGVVQGYSGRGRGPGSTCVDCVAGKYSTEEGSLNCISCAAGSVTNTLGSNGASSCTACSAGQYSPNSQTACQPCGSGSVTNTLGSSGATTCTTCSAGQYSPNSQTACQPCTSGSVTNTLGSAGASSCTACSAGQYSPNYQTACQACPPGSVTNTLGSSGATTCTSCPAGQYSSSSTSACQPCGPGSVTNTLGSAGASSCTTCSAGQYSPNSQTACQVCPSGSVTNTGSSSGASTCTSCQPGQYSSSSTSACQPCGPGSVTNTLGRAGATTCGECEAGQYSQNSQTACQGCPGGQYSGSSGLNECSECVAGQYQDGVGQTSCRLCDVGQYQGNAGSTSCNDCGAGKYSSEQGRSTDCINCDAGKYSSEIARSTDCVNCVAGKYSTTEGSPSVSNCIDCGVGKYSGEVGSNNQDTCISCPSGKYVDTPVNNSESDCHETKCTGNDRRDSDNVTCSDYNSTVQDGVYISRGGICLTLPREQFGEKVLNTDGSEILKSSDCVAVNAGNFWIEHEDITYDKTGSDVEDSKKGRCCILLPPESSCQAVWDNGGCIVTDGYNQKVLDDPGSIRSGDSPEEILTNCCESRSGFCIHNLDSSEDIDCPDQTQNITSDPTKTSDCCEDRTGFCISNSGSEEDETCGPNQYITDDRTILKNSGNCCINQSQCDSTFECGQGKFMDTSKYCTTDTCDDSRDREICCTPKENCSGYTGLCPSSKYVDPTSYCSTDNCTSNDILNCCTLDKASCNDLTDNCPLDKYKDLTNYCNEGVCTSSDIDICCTLDKASCSTFTNECPTGKTLDSERFCNIQTCSISDRSNCCIDVVDSADPSDVAGQISGQEGTTEETEETTEDTSSVESSEEKIKYIATYPDANITDIPVGSSEREQFETDFIQALQSSMSDVSTEIVINSISGGSIIVDFTVKSRENTLQELNRSLTNVINNKDVLSITINNEIKNVSSIVEPSIDISLPNEGQLIKWAYTLGDSNGIQYPGGVNNINISASGGMVIEFVTKEEGREQLKYKTDTNNITNVNEYLRSINDSSIDSGKGWGGLFYQSDTGNWSHWTVDYYVRAVCNSPGCNQDCIVSWSKCTNLCETKENRTYTIDVPQSGSGKECPLPAAKDCRDKEDDCNNPKDGDFMKYVIIFAVIFVLGIILILLLSTGSSKPLPLIPMQRVVPTIRPPSIPTPAIPAPSIPTPTIPAPTPQL